MFVYLLFLRLYISFNYFIDFSEKNNNNKKKNPEKADALPKKRHLDGLKPNRILPRCALHDFSPRILKYIFNN